MKLSSAKNWGSAEQTWMQILPSEPLDEDNSVDVLTAAWWDSEQKTQLIHDRTTDPQKTRDNKCVFIKPLYVGSLCYAAKDNSYKPYTWNMQPC